MSDKIRTRNYLFLFFIFLTGNSAHAQDTLTVDSDRPVLKTRIACVAAVSSALYITGYLYANNNWDTENTRVPFFFNDDLKGYFQLDKFQHSLGSYYESYITYHFLYNSGVARKKALLWSAPMGLIIQSPKEIIDGQFPEGGFSWSDIAADFAGSAFFVAQELIFNDQLVKFKFSFSKSEYADMTHGFLGTNLIQNYFKDYNSHTYWLTISADRILLKGILPQWLGISAGYSANGMLGKYKNWVKYNGYLLPVTPRYRQFLLSLDIDWTKIKTRSKFLKAVLNTMVFIKLPFPAIEINSLGNFKGHWIYY